MNKILEDEMWSERPFQTGFDRFESSGCGILETDDRGISGSGARRNKKSPRPHQEKAIAAFHEHFQTGERGKLIMACGTGKTFTSLKIAEKETSGKGLVLFLAPSIRRVSRK